MANRQVARVVYRSMLRWSRGARIRDAAFTLPSLEPSGAVDDLLIRISQEKLGASVETAALRPRGASGFRAAARAAFSHWDGDEMEGLDLAFEVLKTLPPLEEAIAEQTARAAANVDRAEVTSPHRSAPFTTQQLRQLPPSGVSETPILERNRLPPRPPAFRPQVQFRVGDVVQHRLFHYRGVVVGWDRRPVMDVAGWNGVRATPSGPNQPFFSVIPDRGDLRVFEPGGSGPHERCGCMAPAPPHHHLNPPTCIKSPPISAECAIS